MEPINQLEEVMQSQGRSQVGEGGHAPHFDSV